jgi:hypothetical protein
MGGFCGGEKKFLASTRNRTPAVKPAARRYTDWDIPSKNYVIYILSEIF